MKVTRTHKVQQIADMGPGDHHQQRTIQNQFQELTPITFNEKTQLREIDGVLLNMDALSDTALTLKKINFDMKMKNESRKNEAMRKCLLFKQKLKELADDFERHIASELDYLQHAENMQIESRIDECEKLFNDIELSKDVAQNLKTEFITSQTIHKVNAARLRCNEYKYSLQRVHSLMQPVEYNLAIDRNVADAINKSPAVLGKIEVTHEPLDEEKTAVKGGNVQISRRTSNVSQFTRRSEHRFPMETAQAQKLHEISLQTREDQDEVLITSICTLNSGNLATLDRSNNKLLLARPDGAVLIQYIFSNQIWDMALIDQSMAAVTVPDHEKIIIVRIRDSAIVAERLIKANNVCYGVCSIDGYLVITVKGGYVKIISKAGETMATVRHNHHGDILFQDPRYVATNRDQNELYVTDYDLHTVTALRLSGIKVDPRPKFVFYNNELRSPTGICLDSQGNIYVCGCSTHNVLQLSPDGLLIQILVSGIVNPQTVALATLEERMFLSGIQTGVRGKHTQNVIEVYKLF